MCTVVLLRRPGADWPLILGANRDEMANRPWRAPGRHWPDRDDIIAGLDIEAGGSWLGINESGVIAAVLNRPGTLGPAAGRRSRGELVLEALDHADAVEAARALTALDPAAYRPFNLVLADNRDAFWMCHADGTGERPVEARPIPVGLSMITAHGLDDIEGSPRVRSYLPLFRRAAVPDPAKGDWAAWEALLASRVHDVAGGPAAAMCFEMPNGFATVSSALIALPAPQRRGMDRPVFRFAPRVPESGPWQDVLEDAD